MAMTIDDNPKPTKSMVDLASELRNLKDRKEGLEGELQKVNSDIGTCESTLYDIMVNDQISQFKVDGIGTVYLHSEIYPKVWDEPTFFSWLRSHRFGAIIKETVHPSTLKAFLKDLGEELDGVEITTKHTARIRRS